jgi:hypothetical protein
MTLLQFSLCTLAVFVVLLIAGVLIEAEVDYRKRQIKRVRDLKVENAQLRAQIHRQRWEHDWYVDEAKTREAVKDLLLRQKWAEAQKRAAR